jgi:hypothetical protein
VESKSVPSLGASSADFRGLIPRNNAQQVGHHALRQPRAERSAVDGSNALQPEAVIEAGPRKHGIDENLLLDRAERSQFELSGDFANSLH